jgi:hypothetical protein
MPTIEGALLRARLTAALRSAPSELMDAVPSETLPAGPQAEASDARALATIVEAASPGLGLLVQLRTQLFGDAERAAGQRGFEQAVAVGRGFAIAERHDIRSIPLVEVEHPAVLAVRESSRPSSCGTIAAENLEEYAWTALCDSAWDPRSRRTFFIVEGICLWGSAGALPFWLRKLHEAASGSEMLLNLLDAEAAEHAGQAGRFASVEPTGIDVGGLAALARAVGVELVHAFDSAWLQELHLGFSDLIVREHYAWLRTSDSVSSRDSGRPPWLPRRDPSVASRELPARPHLRDGVAVSTGSSDRMALSLELTPHRSCSVPLDAGGDLVWRLQAAGFLAYDHDGSQFDLRLDAVAQRMGLSAFAIRQRAKCRLDAVRELALAALSTDDAEARDDVRRLLAATSDNVATGYLRRLLADHGVLCAREASVAVAARRPSTPREVLDAARDAFAATAGLLELAGDVHLLVDVTSGRDGIPLTIVADGAPCTVVRIPTCRWSPAAVYHELTHVLATCGSRWLTEGLAVWVQRRLAPDETFPPQAASTVGRRRRPLSADLSDARCGDRSDHVRRLSASDYGEAGDFVTWLMAKLGRGEFFRVFDACRSGAREPVDALCRSLGLGGLEGLEADWLGGVS